jgi:hypothetical protein
MDDAYFGKGLERCDGATYAMHPVVEQDSRGARFSGQEIRNRFVRVAHVRHGTHWRSPAS